MICVYFRVYRGHREPRGRACSSRPFHIVMFVLGRLMQVYKTKLEMTSFWHVTVPSLEHQPCFSSYIRLVLSCIPISHMNVKQTAANYLVPAESGLRSLSSFNNASLQGCQCSPKSSPARSEHSNLITWYSQYAVIPNKPQRNVSASVIFPALRGLCFRL